MSDEASEDSKVFFLLEDNDKGNLENKHSSKGNLFSPNDNSGVLQLEPLSDDTYNIELDFKKFGIVKDERRSTFRVPYWGQVFIHEKNTQKTITAQAKDINSQGIGLTLPAKSLEIGKEIIIEFPGSGSLKAFSLEAKVKNITQRKNGNFVFGFEVIHMSKLTRKKIQSYIDDVIDSGHFSDTDVT